MLPLEAQYWTVEDIAEALKVSKSQVYQRIAPQPSFPAARRIPTVSGRGHPRWKATEVLAWIESCTPRAHQ